MFRKGGSANEGIMHGLDRSGYAGGGTIGGGTIQGTDLGYRTGFSTFAPIGSSPVAYTGTEGLISQGMAEELAQSPAALKKAAEKNPWLMRLLPWLRFSGAAAIGSGIGGLADFYLRSTDTPQAYAERKKIIDEDRFAYDETNLDVGELFERVSEKQKIGEPPGFFPRGGKKKWYEEKGIDPETGKATRIDVTEPPGGTQLPSYKKPNGDLNNITNQDLAAIAKDAKETLKEKNKRYMEMMAPHMQKRMVADALGAASEAFGESTGNTRQDIANAISAAAKGMGGTKDIYDKVSMLTLQGEIAKDIEKSKGTKPNLMESKIEFLRNVKDNDGVRKYSESAIGDILTGAGEKTYEELFTETGSPDIASRRWAKLNYPDVVQTFSAADDVDADFIKKLKDGVYYVGMGKDGDRFFRVEGGKIDDKFSRRGIL